MKHPNFYHWHSRAELQPPTDVLEARWEAASKFAEKLPAADAHSLLQLALFGANEPEFAKRFSEALVVLEPTFLPERNAELLRVMATAALYSQMETGTIEADAVALGLQAAAFQPNRIKPVCNELAQRAAEYLAKESERVRPTPNVEGKYRALEEAVDGANWPANSNATQLIGDAVLELGETMQRISEENQFLWWLEGRHSSFLERRRETLTPKEYALAAAIEAEERVALLPPSPSVESLIGEVLTHCSKPSNLPIPLVDFINAVDIKRVDAPVSKLGAQALCPINTLLEVRRAEGKVDGAALGKLNILTKLKVSPTEAAVQYYRELVFFRALERLD